MTGTLSPDLNAWLRLTPDQRQAADCGDQIIDRKKNPKHPLYDPHVTLRQLAHEAGEDEPTVSRLWKRWTKGLRRSDGELLAPPHCKAALAPRLPGPPRGRSLLLPEKAQEILDLAAKLVRRSGGERARSDQGGERIRMPFALVHKEFEAKEELIGEKAPGYAQIRSVLSRVPYQTRLVWAGGAEALKKDGGLPRLIVPPPEAPNLVWLLDQWVVDAFILYEDGSTGRPVVLSVIDAFGGGPVLGLAIHRRFSAHTVAEALIDAILRHGKGACLRLDLGRENRAKLIRCGCQAIGMKLMHTTPRDPAVKGLMEQTHGNYRRFCSTLPWYAPSNIKTKPVRTEAPLSFAEFTDRFTAFAFGEYNQAPYTGQYAEGRKSRLELRQAAQFTPIIRPEDELRILFSEAKLVKVHPQGIHLHGLVYTHPALAARIGQKVWARQGRTDVEVIVHDEAMDHLICVARNALAESAGLDDETRRQFTTDRRALSKAMATQADEQISRAASRPDYYLLRARKRRGAQEQAPSRRAVRQIGQITGETPQAQAAAGRRLKLFRNYD